MVGTGQTWPRPWRSSREGISGESALTRACGRSSRLCRRRGRVWWASAVSAPGAGDRLVRPQTALRLQVRRGDGRLSCPQGGPPRSSRRRPRGWGCGGPAEHMEGAPGRVTRAAVPSVGASVTRQGSGLCRPPELACAVHPGPTQASTQPLPRASLLPRPSLVHGRRRRAVQGGEPGEGGWQVVFPGQPPLALSHLRPRLLSRGRVRLCVTVLSGQGQPWEALGRARSGRWGRRTRRPPEVTQAPGRRPSGP